jgi:anaerobic magnesium-protoporphyrin IX monomethyl ester cyclase
VELLHDISRRRRNPGTKPQKLPTFSRRTAPRKPGPLRVLLINPPDENTVIEYPDEEGEGYLESDDYGSFPPLGLLYILSAAEKALPQHEYFFLDCVAERVSHQDLPRRLDEIKPDVVGITSFTISLVDVVKAAKITRAAFPDAFIVLGGHHPTAFPRESTQLDVFDCTVVGEGEFAFIDILRALGDAGDLHAIQGVYTEEKIKQLEGFQFRDNRFLNHLVVPPAYVDDVDEVPPPNRKYIQHIDYASIVGLTGKLATLVSSRGCPYSCTFCDVPYKRYRERSHKLVVDEIEQCLALGYREFHFYDDLFNITPQKMMAFCDELERRKLDIVWDFRGRTNLVTRESLARAKSCGLRMISFGVETGTDEGLKRLKKGTTVKQVREAFQWCRELGIKTIANFMMGLPHETNEADVMENIDFLIELDPDYAQVAILSLYPHTPDYDIAIERGLIEKGRWERWVVDPKPGFHVDHWEEFMTTRELVQIHRRAYRRFYFRPRYIARSVLSTRSSWELKSKVKGVLQLIGVG